MSVDSAVEGLQGLSLLPDPGGETTAELISKLKEAEKAPSKRGRAKKSLYRVWDREGLVVTGWKFNEWDYGSLKVNLPTTARGLFTIGDRIVVRGYNKFFNVGEVPTTKWEWIEEHTRGPYYLTNKENGCIVFMAGLKDGTLLVTSKHSTGPREDAPDLDRNHSWVAKTRVERHLAQRGIDKKELAEELYRLNITAVGELCDDDFEEHVLPYRGDRAGIYLHGLNLNTPKFATYSIEDVDRFAAKYGFFPTPYTVKENVAGLKKFLEECAETGSWNGVDIEGFVIRCKYEDVGDSGDFFFKYKFEEPYLMYRDWRELTRSYIHGKGRSQLRINRHMAACNQYLDFVIPILDKDPKLRHRYQQSHGIIELRERFLAHVNKKGIELADAEDGTHTNAYVGDTKYVIAPLAVIGSGKTTLGVALRHLFGWGHVQNDELTGKQKKMYLIRGAVNCLDESEVVIVDRNNHMFHEREQLINDMRDQRSGLKFICLNFCPDDVSRDELWRITRARVTDRGDNHSTIQSSHYDERKIDGICGGFFKRLQPLAPYKFPDSEFDTVIDLNVADGSRANLEKIVNALREKYPSLIRQVSAQELDDAIAAGLAYKAKDVGLFGKAKKKDNGTVRAGINDQEVVKKKHRVVYYLLKIDPQTSIPELVDAFFAANPENRYFWDELKATGVFTKLFHVTLVHTRGRSHREKELYEYYQETYDGLLPERPKNGLGDVPLPAYADVKIVSIGFNARALALGVELIDSTGDAIVCSADQPHITVGHVSGGRPFESNRMFGDPSSLIMEWNIEPSILKHQQLNAFL
ncbi:tRNA ligase [Trichomonascus vanleenenianus]|uniref:tRNA ligase n=1 Tax=Trichomonascus vanleenenianus TaxID=2268995 RepID=UPI003ECAD481